MTSHKCNASLMLFLLLWAMVAPAFAGGPLITGSAKYGTEGKALTWDISQGPIQYRVDGGPLSQTSSGTIVIDNAAGLTRVQNLFLPWQSVSTTAISYHNAGSILPVPPDFTDGDVSNLSEFNAVTGSCNKAIQSPIMFDADGTIFAALGVDPAVIGFAGPCAISTQGRILSAQSMLNGKMQDGLNNGSANYEITADEFDATMIHEFGHFSGLDHSQINLDCLTNLISSNGQSTCSTSELQGLPTMFPVLLSSEQKTLAADDIAWISYLYPNNSFVSSYGVIKGTVYFSDGVSPVQGVNVIARNVGNSNILAYSAVSGLYFTDNIGQPYTGDNTGGSTIGSHKFAHVGYFEIPVPPGTYTVEAESIFNQFGGGSSVGPLSLPITMPGAFLISQPLNVSTGGTTQYNITLQNTPPSFDTFEGRMRTPRYQLELRFFVRRRSTMNIDEVVS